MQDGVPGGMPDAAPKGTANMHRDSEGRGVVRRDSERRDNVSRNNVLRGIVLRGSAALPWRPARRLAGLLGVGLAGLLGWWAAAGWRGEADAEPARMAAAEPVRMRPSASSMAPSLPPAPRLAAVALASRSPPRPLASGEVEVCGYGPVQLPSDDPNPLQRIPLAVRQAALAQAEAQMLAHPQAAVRAAALLIGARARLGNGPQRIQQLARLAAASQDPAAYAIALQACHAWAHAGTDGNTEAGACALLSRAQWARLEPDNLQPWLEMAAEAAAQNDDEAEADAMRRAALAPRSDERAGLLPALVAQALGPQVPALQRALALSLARGIQDGWVLAHSNHADAWCSSLEAGAEPARQAVCGAVAQTLMARSRSLADVASGMAIGRQLGWSAERLHAGQQQQRVAMQLVESADDTASTGLDFSCERLALRQAWSRRIGERGELAALRERLERAPVVASGVR